MNAGKTAPHRAVFFRRISRSIGAKLFIVLLSVLLVSLTALGFVVIGLLQRNLEAARVSAAERISDVIRRSTTYSMLRNDRQALQEIVSAVGRDSGVVDVRISKMDGRIAFSSHLEEVGRVAPFVGGSPMQQRTRTFHENSERVLAISAPILNTPTCSSAACHAHPSSNVALGVLEVDLSLAQADAGVRTATRQFVFYSALIVILTLSTIGALVWQLVHRPVHKLRDATERLRDGELGVQIDVASHDELGALAASFNKMSRELKGAREEITAANATLEERVEQKTAELQIAHRQMIQAEKLTSLGKLAAVVAHEINNPLFGILTYAKLLRKWIDRGDSLAQRAGEMRESLLLIESESRRCGDLVRNLLTFARVAPMNISDVNLNALVRQCLKLVEHKLELGNVVAHLDLDENLPYVRGDAGQLEQLLLALIMNAIDAMPREGNLTVVTRPAADRSEIIVTIADDGTGIDPSVLQRLFDPFVTTKEEGKGVGLGLPISRSIVERHQGKIEVKSEADCGTTFTITLPVAPAIAQQVNEPPAAVMV
jgi:two-component system NtrC family sensor kinase